MKVCMLTTTFPQCRDDPIGRATIYNLTKALVRSGINVTVVAPGAKDASDFEIMDGIEVYRFTYWIPKSQQRLAYRYSIPINLKRSFLAKLQLPFFIIFFFIKGLKIAKNCDIIHANMTPIAILAYIIRWFINKPIVVTPWGTDLRDLPKKFSEYVLKHADVVTVPDLGGIHHVNFHNYRVIPTPISEDIFNRDVDVSSLKNEFKLENEFVVTFIARLYAFKDPLTFVKSVPKVLREIQNVKFFVVGDGVLLEEVRSIVEESGIEDSVFVTGQRSDINVILKASTLFAAVSPIENVWSNTIAEAMFIGIPCMITNAGASKEFFTHMKNCYMIKPCDPKALAKAIVYLLKNPESREKLTKGGLEFLKEQNKDISRVVELTKQLYAEVLENYSR